MDIWMIMILMYLIIPLMMIIFGYYFYKETPRNINKIFGYRTKRSMINKDTWNFAHLYFGKLALIIGSISLLLSLIVFLLFVNKGIDVIGRVGLIVTFVQLVILFIPIIPTERALKRTFDKEGNRVIK